MGICAVHALFQYIYIHSLALRRIYISLRNRYMQKVFPEMLRIVLVACNAGNCEYRVILSLYRKGPAKCIIQIDII